MQIVMESLALLSHMLFITIFFRLLTDLVDWSKILKLRQDNSAQVRMLVLLLSLVLGYLASHFVLEIIALGQTFASLF